jgi:hypothetical protein
MSPEAQAGAVQLTLLLAELRRDQAALTPHARELQELRSDWPRVASDRPRLVLACVLLHAWYTGLETLFERIARGLDRSVPRGDQSHKELLRQMATELPGLRAAVIDDSIEAELLQLLKFRHFFRHAYAVPYDPVKVLAEVERVVALHPRLDANLASLERFLDDSIAALASA